ncbi:MAG TPA: TA system VapC family ribonuclease toxin [bacterium]
MVAVDTNVLVFAEIAGSPKHARAREVLTSLAEGVTPWALPWPCVYEFLRVVTHPRVFSPPVPLARALEDVGHILASPSLVLLRETERHPEIMRQVIAESGAAGNLLHDAHIAALCREHGVGEIITGDRDFSRFSGLSVTDPF